MVILLRLLIKRLWIKKNRFGILNVNNEGTIGHLKTHIELIHDKEIIVSIALL
jgi:hypothetical protein